MSVYGRRPKGMMRPEIRSTAIESETRRVLRACGTEASQKSVEIPHSGVEFSRDITERYLNDTHVAWTPAHDARLLAAVCCHGYGHFADVAPPSTSPSTWCLHRRYERHTVRTPRRICGRSTR